MEDADNPPNKKTMTLAKLRELAPRTQAVILGKAIAKRKEKDALAEKAKVAGIQKR